jgi:ABC-type antimicrobial peptide transport system permease subunit
MMFLPIFALSSAVLCLINFHLITIEEQRQEFAILRATGGKPRNILSIMAIQSLTILLSSFAVGISIGTIITILILTANPVISASTVLLISGWLIAAVAAMFLLSLYPAVKFSRKTLIEIIS